MDIVDEYITYIYIYIQLVTDCLLMIIWGRGLSQSIIGILFASTAQIFSEKEGIPQNGMCFSGKMMVDPQIFEAGLWRCVFL